MMAGGKPGTDKKYQAEVREAAWSAILKAVTDPETRRADVREEDIVEALTDLLALVVSTTEAGKSTIAMRDRVDALSKRLRSRANEAVTKQEGTTLFKGVTRDRR